METVQKNGTPFQDEQDAAQTISWTVHPLVENWTRSVILGLFLVFLFLCLYWGFRSIPIALLSVIFLIGSLYKYFLPFLHQCEADRLVISTCCYRLTRRWTAFRSFYVDANGVLLSPFSKPTRLENFRGVYVRFGKHPPEPVVHFISSKIESESSP